MNEKVALVFDRIALLLEVTGDNPFRVRSYRVASETLRGLPRSLEEMVAEGVDLEDLPGIGRALASKVGEVLATGTSQKLEELLREVPPTLTDLLQVRGLGPKKIALLYRELGIKSLLELKAAALEGKIRALPGMGLKTEQNLLRALETMATEAGRISIHTARLLVEALGRHLDSLAHVARWTPAGSFRRRRETIGGVDILVATLERERAIEEILQIPGIAEVTSRGAEKVSVLLKDGRRVDFRFFEPEAFGAAMMAFTGSRAHNIQMRSRAIARGLELNEYGLWNEALERVAGRTEEEVFERLGLAWIAPELREDQGEIDAAETGRLPRLIERGDLRGELHVHTTASDGRMTLSEMAAAAQARGYEYLAITDHSRAVSVASGLDEVRLAAQGEEIRALQATLRGIRLLRGVEVDIRKDGSLDLDLDFLAALDWVVASVHSSFNQREEQLTERLMRAICSGVVDCLGHPLARLIGRRDPLRFDHERVFTACRDHQVALEINAQPDRLDLPDTLCRRAAALGVRLVIATDAHHADDLDLVDYGIGVARRGWLEPAQVLNTIGAGELDRVLRGGLRRPR